MTFNKFFTQKYTYLIVSLCFIALTSCGVYSFSGASISPDTKTFSIKTFTNSAPLAAPNYNQQLSERLKERVLNGTRLYLQNTDADIRFEGEVVDYSTRPNAITGAEVAATTRLSITVKVIYTNTKNEKQNFEQNFTRYADFNADQNLNTVVNALTIQINNDLVEDIFNKAFVNW